MVIVKNTPNNTRLLSMFAAISNASLELYPASQQRYTLIGSSACFDHLRYEYANNVYANIVDLDQVGKLIKRYMELERKPDNEYANNS